MRCFLHIYSYNTFSDWIFRSIFNTRGHLRTVLHFYFRSFQSILQSKICRLSGIRTRIVGTEWEYADHLTTTTAYSLSIILLDAVLNDLNKQSGLFGLTGLSDFRDVINEVSKDGNPKGLLVVMEPIQCGQIGLFLKGLFGKIVLQK